MKLKENIRVFCVRIGGSNKITLLNSNYELRDLIQRFIESSNGYIDLNYLLELEFSKSTFDGVINQQYVQINLYKSINYTSNISLIELEGENQFTFEDIQKSELFRTEAELIWAVGIHQNILSQKLMDILKC